MIPITEQVARYIEVAHDSVDLLIEFLEANRDVIIKTQVRRMSSIGADEYGDATWHLPLEALGVEAIAELSDASFYIGVGVDGLGSEAVRDSFIG